MSIKKNQISVLVLLIMIGMSLQSCLRDQCESTQTFIQLDPVYKTVDEIRTDIQILGPRELVNPGRLYYYNDYLMINEVREGIHIINNANPNNPVNVAFIEIPGNVDMAVKNNILYADNYIDLLAIDITDPTTPVLQNRTEDVFNSISLNQDLGHLVYYEETEITREIDCNDPRWGSGWFFEDDLFFTTDSNLQNAPNASSSGGGAGGNGGSPAPAGVAGSMASFAVVGCYLYAIDEAQVDVFDINNTTNPFLANTFTVEWGIETLFPHGDNLFIGSEAGMFIYDNSNPLNPTYLSEFRHSRACDPVFVKGDHAYVTLRGGTWCEGFNNQLDVINIADLSNPFLVETYPMDNPHGLTIRNNELYLCEGESGLKVFDIEDVEAISSNRLDHVKNFDAYDAIAIPNKEVVMVVGKDGFYQFDISDPKNLEQISLISVVRP